MFPKRVILGSGEFEPFESEESLFPAKAEGKIGKRGSGEEGSDERVNWRNGIAAFGRRKRIDGLRILKRGF
jgi:hypothetical protein